MKTLALFFLAFNLPAFANDLELRDPVNPVIYECKLIIAASDLGKSEGIFTFTAGSSSEGHGGPVTEFKAGKHFISVMANGQWLGISWVREEKKIAEGIFLLGRSDKSDSRVAILYDPSDSGDQVSLGCDLVK